MTKPLFIGPVMTVAGESGEEATGIPGADLVKTSELPMWVDIPATPLTEIGTPKVL
jgi:hypothetical protein